MKLAHGSWVLVTDGGKALILRNRGDEQRLDLNVVKVRHQAVPANRVLDRDRPGRFRTPAGDLATAACGTAHQDLEAVFISKTVRLLDRLADTTSSAAVVVIADPRALGIARAALAQKPGLIVQSEIGKNLVHQEMDTIESAIARHPA